MTIDILTIFPEMFESVLGASILGRAREKGLLTIEATDIRPFSTMKHKNTDDYPFGGGAGMLMTPQPIADAIKAVCARRGSPCVNLTAERDETSASEEEAVRPAKRIYLSPRGVPFTQQLAQQLAREEHLILLCGHYEGVDQRVLDKYIDLEISVGDYVLTGGEVAAMAVTDAVCRMVPGVLADPECFENESHFNGLLEYPQYSRPAVWHGRAVPEILLSGNHEKVRQWRRKQALRRTRARRPDMYEQLDLSSKQDKKLLKEMEAEDREQAGNSENMGAGE